MRRRRRAARRGRRPSSCASRSRTRRPARSRASYELELPRRRDVIGVVARGDVAREMPAIAGARRILDRARRATPTCSAPIPSRSRRLGGDSLPRDAPADRARARGRARRRGGPRVAERPRRRAARWCSPAGIERRARCVPRHVRATPGPARRSRDPRRRHRARGGDVRARRDATSRSTSSSTFARPEPIVWTQTEDLGDGWTRDARDRDRAAAPRRRRPRAHRVLFVIDGSRSMELVGPRNVAQVVDAVARGAAGGHRDRGDRLRSHRRARARRVARRRPPRRSPRSTPALATHAARATAATSPAAFALAHTAIADGARGQTMVIVITDGVLGELADAALDAGARAQDEHASTSTRSSSIRRARAARAPPRSARPVDLYGGSLVEVAVDELDAALDGVDDVAAARVGRRSSSRAAPVAIADRAPRRQRRPSLAFHHGAGAGARARPGTATRRSASAPRPARARRSPRSRSPRTADASFAADGDARDELAPTARRARACARTRPSTPITRSSCSRRRARSRASRRAMIAGGGPYARIVALADPARPTDAASRAGRPRHRRRRRSIGSTLERLFRDQLAAARVRVLPARARRRTPKLAGTVLLRLPASAAARSRRSASTGLGDARSTRACVDAGYALSRRCPTSRSTPTTRRSRATRSRSTLRDDRPVDRASATPTRARRSTSTRSRAACRPSSTPTSRSTPRRRSAGSSRTRNYTQHAPWVLLATQPHRPFTGGG